MTQRQLPHNLDIERAVLATILMGNHAVAIHQAQDIVSNCCFFYDMKHRKIYHACQVLAAQGATPSATEVAAFFINISHDDLISDLRRIEDAELIGEGLSAKDVARLVKSRKYSPVGDNAEINYITFSDLVAIATSFAPTTGLTRNCEALADLYAKRRVIMALQRAADNAYATQETSGEIIDSAVRTVLGLRATRSAQIVTAGSAAEALKETLANADKQPQPVITTSMRRLDEVLRLRRGGLYVLAARPGAGKTSFALTILSNISQLGRRSLFLSLEVDRQDLMKKLLSGYSGVNFSDIDKGTCNRHQAKMLESACDDLGTWPLSIIDTTHVTISGVASACRRHALENKDLDAIFIDYLQLIAPSDKRQTEYEKVSEISRQLKCLARELCVPIVALSQMSRDSEKSATPRKPKLSDLRGSGSIEQDADAVCFLHMTRQEKTTRDISLIVAKNRFGPIDEVQMEFRLLTQVFAESENQDPQQMISQVAARSRNRDEGSIL